VHNRLCCLPLTSPPSVWAAPYERSKVDFKKVGLEKFGRPSGYIQRQLKVWGGQFKSGEEIVRDPEAYKKVGLDYVDKGGYMLQVQYLYLY
jgi:hypothetical protein